MKEPLKFKPGAKFWKDEDGLPVVVEDGKPFVCGPAGKGAIRFFPSEMDGAKRVDEAAFRALIASFA